MYGDSSARLKLNKHLSVTKKNDRVDTVPFEKCVKMKFSQENNPKITHFVIHNPVKIHKPV